jgi:hypothetical protein
VPKDPIDLFLYAGKHKPSIYLDARVRGGIATFAALAEATEVETGRRICSAISPQAPSPRSWAATHRGMGTSSFWLPNASIACATPSDACMRAEARTQDTVCLPEV